MTKILAQLLRAKEPLFGLSLRQLENVSGRHNRDIALEQDIAARLRAVIVALGLDPQDTTGVELYHALITRLHYDNVALLNQNSPSSPPTHRPRKPHSHALDLLQQRFNQQRAWVMKRSVAKQLVKQKPPKKAMKILGYRSVESMLKREPIGDIFAVMKLVEDETWQHEFILSYETLQPHDFEQREIEWITIPSKLRKHEAYHHDDNRVPTMSMRELGTSVILPSQKYDESTYGLLNYIANGLRDCAEIRMYSVYWKLQQVHRHFGKKLVSSVRDDVPLGEIMSGHTIKWRVAHRYFSSKEQNSYHVELFEPHIQPDDMAWRRVEEQLSTICPRFSFWQGHDYIAMLTDGGAVSCNFLDVLENVTMDNPFELRFSDHFRDSLWNELYVRYMGASIIKEQVIRHLDAGIISPGVDE